MRLLLILILAFGSGCLFAGDLYEQLRHLVPGESIERVNERQYLYQQVTSLFEKLEAEQKVHRKNKKKRIKRIQAYLAEHLLLTYDPAAALGDIFRSKRFNDASAAMLLKLCMEAYEVETEVYVDHWRAYSIADPEKRKVEIYFGKKEALKKSERSAFQADYLAAIRATIFPDLPVAEEKEEEATFISHYYPADKPLSATQLAAYDLYLRASAAYGNDQYREAIRLTEEGLKLEDRAPILLVQRAAETQLKSMEEPQIAGNLKTLFQQWNKEPDNQYLKSAILQHFDEEQRAVLTSGKPEATETLLSAYYNRTPTDQPEWKSELRRLQQFRLLSHYHKEGKLEASREIAKELYLENPDSSRMQYLLGEILVGQLRIGSSTGAGFQKRMEVAKAEFPFLESHPRFIDLYLREQAIKIRDLYADERVDLARPALDQFRNTISKLSIGESRNLWTLTAFAAASYYHFCIADYHGAVEYIEEALRYAPDDQYLLHRLSVLQSYL